MIADWEHYAILDLVDTDGFRSDDAWIAEKLGLSLEQTRAALQRLFRLNLMTVKDGVYKPVYQYLSYRWGYSLGSVERISSPNYQQGVGVFAPR